MKNEWKRLRKEISRQPVIREFYFRTWLLRYGLQRVRPKLSYAQAREDLIVEELIGEVKSFVDIGAHDGISGSNTFLFALKGARGLCLEPVRETFLKLRWLHRLNRRVKTVRVGISDEERTTEIVAADFLSYIPDTEDTSHTSFYDVAGYEREKIRLRPFGDVALEEGLDEVVDVLSLDVEGHELKVLQSIPFDRYRFKCMVIETHLLDPETNTENWKHRDYDAIFSLLAEHGYQLASKTYVNSIFIRN